MKCLSCKNEIRSNSRLFKNKIVLCYDCHALAVGMDAKLDALISRTRNQLSDWLEQRILGGGLTAAEAPTIDPTSLGMGSSIPDHPKEE